MDSLGDGSHTWADVAGVIGGFGWKARFVGTDGHLIGTLNSSFGDAGGGHNQINFYGGEFHSWGNYHPTQETIYNYSCFKCHTTGGDTTGTWLDGVDGLGTFSEGGIGCEACHGPGGDHVGGPTVDNIDRVYEYAHLDNGLGGLSIDGVVQMPDTTDDVNFLCGTCHNRSYTDPINSSGGFIRHHEQWDEFVATGHASRGYTCITCHDPHKRVIWDGDGITTTCESCHTAQEATVNHPGAPECIDCHMPYAAKSGTTIGQSGFRGDVRSHLVAITVDTASMFTEDGSAVRDDEMRSASLSPAFTCLGCHNDDPADGIPEMTLADAVNYSMGMHMVTSLTETDNGIASEFALNQNYPNPFNPFTRISFKLPKASSVYLAVYSLNGQHVATLINNENMTSGEKNLRFDAGDLASGVYLYTIRTDYGIASKKMILIK